jgi:hypothetical protein
MDFKQYINAVGKDLGLDDLPETERERVMVDMGEAIMGRALVMIYERLSPSERIEFEKFSPDNIDASMLFLKEKIADFDTLVADAARQVLSEIVG